MYQRYISSHEPLVNHGIAQLCVPRASSLFESIQSFVKLPYHAPHLIWNFKVYVPWQIAVAESGFDIYLADVEALVRSSSEEDTCRNMLRCGCEDFIIIPPSNLFECLGDETCLLTWPNSSLLMVRTNFEGNGVIATGFKTSVYTPFSCNALISSSMACCHKSLSGRCIASLYVAGLSVRPSRACNLALLTRHHSDGGCLSLLG
jgi:hypothetical protein